MASVAVSIGHYQFTAVLETGSLNHRHYDLTGQTASRLVTIDQLVGRMSERTLCVKVRNVSPRHAA
jgi:hypothetical protein